MGKPGGNMKSYTLVELARVIATGNKKGRESALYLFTGKLRDEWGSGETERAEASKVLCPALGASEEVQDALLTLFGKGVPVDEAVQTHFKEGLLGDMLHRVSFYWKARKDMLGDAVPNPLLELAQEKTTETMFAMGRLFNQKISQSDGWKTSTRNLCAQWLDERPHDGGMTAMGVFIDHATQVDQTPSQWGYISRLTSLIDDTLDEYPVWKDLARLGLYPESTWKQFMSIGAISEKNEDIITTTIAHAQLTQSTPAIGQRHKRSRL
jgi:hypothetical protein